MFRKKRLAKILSGLEGFKDPKIEFEQYGTPGDIAAELLLFAYSMGKLENKVIADLGCGTGILSIGSALLGAKRVYAIDIDGDALSIARKNAERLDLLNIIEFVEEDIREFDIKVDTVVMNPPFGCQSRHADRMFLEKAFEVSSDTFSIHLAKEEVERFIVRFSADLGFRAKILKRMKMELPARFFFHRKRLERIDVDLVHFERVQDV